MSKGSFLLKFLIVPATFLILAAAAFSSDDAPRIKPEQLKERLGQPGMQLLDVRIASDWKKSDLKIVGAEHVDPHDVSAWAKAIQKDSFVVAYCS